MSPAFESAAIDLTTAVRTTIDLAVRAATWVLLDDDGIREARDDLDDAFEASDA